MKTMTALLPSWPQRMARWLTRLMLLPAALALAAAAALAAAPRDRLTLLVPDNADLNSWQVKVWIDSAADEGVRLDVIRDAALLALGSTAASKISGLIVPDSAHLRASDALVAAIKLYAFTGGRLMLVYDAGALTEAGTFPFAGSRFADLAGVNYALYDSLGAAAFVGFGPVVGTMARLESLSLPPGKYVPYQPPASLGAVTFTTQFVPASPLDPGGSQAMAKLVGERAAKAVDDGSANVRRQRPYVLRDHLDLDVESAAPLRFARRHQSATKAVDQHLRDSLPRLPDFVGARLNADLRSSTELSAPAAAANDATLQAISGYGFGALSYFHYVTTGAFPGTVHLSSPEHGLVAGTRGYGSGQVLFVNLPLGYFKAVGTDGAPLHGFLNLFARDHVGIASLSVQPRGVGGLIYNWHVDDGDDLNVDIKALLAKDVDVFERGPFSIHFTVGPDVITFGDGNGIDLAHNKAGQDLIRKLGGLGKKSKGGKSVEVKHEIGSHGGWIHDYWGLTANEVNNPDLTNLLKWNFDAIEKVTGVKIREYSSPVGNTPRWAINWLEQRGVVAMYLVGDVGAAMLRSWRPLLDAAGAPVFPPNAARLTSKLWTSPVTPFGKYATFEEFDLFGISDATSGQWLLDLQSFVVNRRTNRMFYNHPPGARGHLNPVNALLGRADVLEEQDRFNWYTMTELADFSQRRIETSWSTSSANGVTTFVASHPTSLVDMTWLLPKSRYTSPAIISGDGSISGDAKDWIVTVKKGTRLTFKANE